MSRLGTGNVTLRLAVVLAMTVLTPSCFRHVVQSRQLPTTAFLQLGSFERGDVMTATGDREYRFIIDGSAETLYEVEQGRYRVTVLRGDVAKAERVVYVAAGETKEITR